MSDGNSKFVHARDAVTGWLSHLWHTETVQSIAQNVEHGGEEVVRTAITSAGTAMLVTHTTGGDKAAVEQAGRDALIGSFKTVGVTVGTDVVEKAITQISGTIHGTTGTAPQPPSA